MTISLKHSYQSAVPDGGDTGLVQPSDWNAEHAITMATNKVLGRATAGTGAVEELSVTGSGDVVLATSPTLVTPALGTPSSGVLTNCTGLPTVVTANEATDTTCFINFTTAASGELGPKTNANLTFNSNTGVLTSASSILTTTDINGGTVDGTVIGGASAAAGTFTTATATQAVITQGTITDPALNLSSTVTWNDAADTFTAWKLNVTNTASDAASMLVDWQVGGTTVANVTAAGVVRSNAGNAYTTAQFGLGNTTSWGLGYHGAETLRGHLVASGATAACFGPNGFATAGYLAFGGFNPDLFLFRDGGATLAQRDGTTAQTSRLYRTYTDGSNYERLALQSGAGYFEVAAETAGTGTDNIDVRLTPTGTGSVRSRGVPTDFGAIVAAATCQAMAFQ
jgi:hypothetical protein